MQRDLLRNCNVRLETHGGPILERVISSFLIESGNSEPDTEFLSCLPAKPYILFVGGLQRRKGLETLLAAYERLSAPPPLVLIGYVASDTPEEFPNSVTILQNIPHPNVMLAWEHCLFGVMPSVWPDPSPGVVREVMSMGKAVIGTNIGGTTEMIVHGETGLLVPPNDVDALAKAMQRLIDDVKLREQLGQAAREQAKQFTAAANVPRFEQLYQQLTSNSKGQADKHSSLVMGHRPLQYHDHHARE
jgi:glycosyltransferase involved in cell wall biosynthesis